MALRSRRMKPFFLLGFVVWVLLLFIIYFQKTVDTVHDQQPVSYSYSYSNFQWQKSTRSNHVLLQAVHKKKGLDKGDAGIKKVLEPTTPKKRRKKNSDDWEEYKSKGKKVVQALWMGKVSSKMLSKRLQNAKSNYTYLNTYKVYYTQQQRRQQGKKELLCQLKQKAKIRTLNGAEEPFTSLGWEKLVPSQPLEKLHGTPYKTCAVVSSAGAILKSSLGQEIDSHDAVLRFNAAPTKGFQKDVGNKTTFRIINSKWYENPDFDLFTAYADFRKRFPEQPFYILHPTFLWSLWNMIQDNTDEEIQPDPPSSGFIGIALMMGLCETVDVYEFIPSKRHTTLCHYYSDYADMACTLGAFHPLLFEKLLVRKMSSSSYFNLINKGKATLPGFSQVICPS
ncbi:beta-galactoside alpha-2,6-sialyltransferase 2b isoform X2 [Hoplias malabaricus]|uniref:beta-galactoside alpha-2,6-sialyltransferase 2b isoform X2 n=1 Tax=Hoplias malabaricus TaxID=27720 RepID=UPI003462DD4A